MTVTTASLASTKQVAAVLIAQHGWVRGYSGAAAELSGVASFGHDGTVLRFGRNHATGYPLADEIVGEVDLAAAPADAAAQAVALLG